VGKKLVSKSFCKISGANEWGLDRLTVWAATPIGHFGFIDFKTVVIGCFETGPVADRAIDVGYMAAFTADQMVVIVANPAFIESGTSNWLDAAYAAPFHQQTESVVYRLTRDSSNFTSGRLVNDIGSSMRVAIDRFHHRQALGCDVDPEMTKGGGKVGTHGMNSSTQFVLSPNFGIGCR